MSKVQKCHLEGALSGQIGDSEFQNKIVVARNPLNKMEICEFML